MLMEQARNEIVKYGKVISKKLTTGTSGNLSIADREKKLVAISPSGIDYDQLTPEDIVIVNFDGDIIEGTKKPSSEVGLHLGIYKQNKNAKAVVHTHALYCTIFASLNMPLRSVHYVLASTGSDHVPVVEYATYGSKELAEKVSEKMKDYNAVLMANHGMVCCADTLKEAVSLADTCEWVAELQYKCMTIGEPQIVPKEEIDHVMECFKHYGQEEETETSAHDK